MTSAPRPAEGAALDAQDVVDVLRRGDLEVRGRLVDASNATLYAAATMSGVLVRCVYKPIAGERPLWDFPARTLACREVAAYILSAATGWDVVPPTVFRTDGPFGAGSVQAWVGPPDAVDENGTGTDVGDENGTDAGDPGAGLIDIVLPDHVPAGWLHVLRAQTYEGNPVSLVHADHPALRRMSVFDAVANNADRKAGHVLRSGAGELFGVDHGLTFNVENKLRTVLWGWAGRRLPDDVLDVLRALAADLDDHGPLHRGLRDLLAPAEVDGTLARIQHLLHTRRHPRPGGSRHPIPWPAF